MLLACGTGGAKANVQASKSSWGFKSSRASVAVDISVLRVIRATVEVERVQPMREGWEGCQARERTSVDSGKSWKVANNEMCGRGSVASL